MQKTIKTTKKHIFPLHVKLFTHDPAAPDGQTHRLISDMFQKSHYKTVWRN